MENTNPKFNKEIGVIKYLLSKTINRYSYKDTSVNKIH